MWTSRAEELKNLSTLPKLLKSFCPENMYPDVIKTGSEQPSIYLRKSLYTPHDILKYCDVALMVTQEGKKLYNVGRIEAMESTKDKR